MATLSLNPRIWFGMLGLTLALIISGFWIWYFSDIFMYTVVALVIISLLHPFVDFFVSRGFQKRTASQLSLIFSLVIYLVLASIFLPALLDEISDIDEQWPNAMERFNTDLVSQKETEEGLSYYVVPLDISIDEATINGYKNSVLSSIADFVSGFLSNLLSALIIVPILTFILLKESSKMGKDMVKLVPNRVLEPFLAMIYETKISVKDYIRAKGIQALILSVVSILGFWIVGLPISLFSGLFVGIINIIPYLGPVLGWLGAALGAYIFGGTSMLINVSIIFLIVQLIDNLIIQPFLIPRLVNMNPLLAVIVTLMGAKFGPVGMVLAIPIFSTVGLLYFRFYEVLFNYYKEPEI